MDAWKAFTYKLLRTIPTSKTLLCRLGEVDVIKLICFLGTMDPHQLCYELAQMDLMQVKFTQWLTYLATHDTEQDQRASRVNILTKMYTNWLSNKLAFIESSSPLYPDVPSSSTEIPEKPVPSQQASHAIETTCESPRVRDEDVPCQQEYNAIGKTCESSNILEENIHPSGSHATLKTLVEKYVENLDISSPKYAGLLGMAMEGVVRDVHVDKFSKPLRTRKPTCIVSTHSPLPMKCTADIELVDKEENVHTVFEVKTMVKAKVPSGINIPDNADQAKMFVKTLLGKSEQYVVSVKNRAPRNIFMEKYRLVDIDLLKSYGDKHATFNKKVIATSRLSREFLFQSCTPRPTDCVELYFYEPWNTSGNHAKAFCVPIEEFGLTVNPFCPATNQMFIQEYVYRTSSEVTLCKRNPKDSLVHLLLVVPYITTLTCPKPYLIIKMPLHFSDDLFNTFEKSFQT